MADFKKEIRYFMKSAEADMDKGAAISQADEELMHYDVVSK
jgi:hypothetical protein